MYAQPNHANSPFPPIVYVLSFVRSGSTLLKSMLNKHSRIFAPAELHLQPFADLGDAQQMFRRTMMHQGVYEAAASLLGDEAAAREIVDRFREERTPVADIYRWFLQRLNGRYLVDKSPTYLTHPDILQRAERMGAQRGVPPLYIFLYRHPFDILDSATGSGFDKLFKVLHMNYRRIRREPDKHGDSAWFTPFLESEELPCDTPLQCSESAYINTMRNALQFLSGTPAGRQMHIAYEGIIREPGPCMQQVCDFLSLEFEPAMLDPYQHNARGDVVQSESVGDPHFYRHHDIRPEFSMKWLRRKDQWEATPIQHATVLLSEQLGYRLDNAALATVPTPAQQCYMKQYRGTPPLIIEFSCTLELGEAGLNTGRLQHCLQHLVERHAELRMGHDPENPGMMTIRQRMQAPPIRHLDLTGESEAGREVARAAALARLSAELARPEAPMFRILAARLDGRRYRFTYLFHHLIADGYAMQNFHRWLWQRYAGHGNPDPHTSGEPLDRDPGLLLSTCRRRMDAQKDKAFWLDALGTPGPWSQAGLDMLADNTVASMHSRHFGPQPAPGRHSFFPAALAWYHTLAELDGCEHPVIAHRLHRRHLRAVYDLKERLGWLAGDAPVPLDVGQPVRRQLAALRRSLAGLPMGGLSYDWLYLQDELPPLYARCAVRLNYYPLELAAGDGLPAASDLRVHLHQPEQAMRDYLLDVIIREHPDGCRSEIRYSRLIHSDAQIEALYAIWQRHFRAVCRAQEAVSC